MTHLEDVLGGAAEQDGARLGVLALDDVGEVLVADLLDLEQPAAGADILLLEVARVVGDRGARGARDAVVVGLADAADARDTRLVEVVRGKLGDALLGDDQVGLQGDDGVAHALNVLLLLLQDEVPVLLLHDLDLGDVQTENNKTRKRSKMRYDNIGDINLEINYSIL